MAEPENKSQEKHANQAENARGKQKRFHISKESILKWGVIIIIALFVMELFFVIMYSPTGQTNTTNQNQSTTLKSFSGYGESTAKIVSFLPDFFVVCNATNDAAVSAAIGDAFNQSPAIAVGETAKGAMYYLKAANASQIDSSLLGSLALNLSSICSGAPVLLRQAQISFTSQITLYDDTNYSNTANLSAYSLRFGSKAFITDAKAVEGDEIGVGVQAALSEGQITKFVAQQTSPAQDLKPVEVKQGTFSAKLVRWMPRGVASVEASWVNRSSFNATLVKQGLQQLTLSNASPYFEQVDQITVFKLKQANQSMLDALQNLSFVRSATIYDNETISLSVSPEFSDEALAKSQILSAMARFTNRSSVYFDPSILRVVFDAYANNSFENATREIDNLLPGANFNRYAVVEPTNLTAANEQVGFNLTSEFQAILVPDATPADLIIVSVLAQVQGDRVISFYAEGGKA